MINATCVGRLTNDPEVKQDSKGQDYVKFSLACQKTRDTAEFVKCAAFGQQANVVSDFVKKGHQVVCVGRMSLNTYETSDGVKRSDLSLAVTQLLLNVLKRSKLVDTIVSCINDCVYWTRVDSTAYIQRKCEKCGADLNAYKRMAKHDQTSVDTSNTNDTQDLVAD